MNDEEYLVRIAIDCRADSMVDTWEHCGGWDMFDNGYLESHLSYYVRFTLKVTYLAVALLIASTIM